MQGMERYGKNRNNPLVNAMIIRISGALQKILEKEEMVEDLLS